jgi:hypothetical protein
MHCVTLFLHNKGKPTTSKENYLLALLRSQLRKPQIVLTSLSMMLFPHKDRASTFSVTNIFATLLHASIWAMEVLGTDYQK